MGRKFAVVENGRAMAGKRGAVGMGAGEDGFPAEWLRGGEEGRAMGVW